MRLQKIQVVWDVFRMLSKQPGPNNILESWRTLRDKSDNWSLTLSI